MDIEKRIFVGMKISKQLQNELDRPAPGTDRYFKDGNPDYLHVVDRGEQRLIGRFLNDGFPLDGLDDVARNLRSIVKLITGGKRMDEDSVRIYVS